MSDDQELDWVALSGKRAKGRRPEFFDDFAVDRLMSVTLAVVGEVSALRDRLDTVERLLDAKGTISREDIENYAPDREAGEERGLSTKAYIARVMRGFQQAADAIGSDEPPLAQLVEEMSRK